MPAVAPRPQWLDDSFLRGFTLGLAGKLPPVANLFWRKASGL